MKPHKWLITSCIINDFEKFGYSFCTRIHSLRKVKELVEETTLPERFLLETILPTKKNLATMPFKMIVALSGILLVSDLCHHIFQELRKQDSASIFWCRYLNDSSCWREGKAAKSEGWNNLAKAFLTEKKICSTFQAIKLMFSRFDGIKVTVVGIFVIEIFARCFTASLGPLPFPRSVIRIN